MRSAAFLLIALAGPAFAADEWVRVATPRFELYTTAGEKKGREALQYFEQVRDFFLKASPVHGSSAFPVRVIQFATPAQYGPYRPNTFSGAYFASPPWGDYIVLGDLATNPVAIHEYMHLIIRHSGLKIPVWLNEGWADVYSSMRPEGKGMAVGDLLQDRIDILVRDNWLSFDELTSTDASSPDYHEASRAGIFYAESWALAHMLYLSPEYAPNFGKFVTALNRGATSAEACQAAFGRSSEQVFQDLKIYLDRRKIYGRVFDAGTVGVAAAPTVSPVSKFDERLMLADLWVSTNRVDNANREYAQLEMEQPGNPGIARGRGFAAVVKQDPESARRYFEKAFDQGETDPRMCLELAKMERLAGRAAPAKILQVLERALQSKPDYTEAKIEVGLVKEQGRDFAGAIATLMAIPNITSDQAVTVFCALSYGFVETGDSAAARQNAAKCRQYAKTDAEVKKADDMVVRAGETLQRATGTLIDLECSSEGNRLRIAAAGKPITFDMPHGSVEMVRMPASYKFACGTLQPLPVTVEYGPAHSAVEISIGTVRSILF
jgi:tetratricopeptide (TPR) repeat protein